MEFRADPEERPTHAHSGIAGDIVWPKWLKKGEAKELLLIQICMPEVFSHGGGKLQVSTVL
jgi:hypothetical protein